MEPYGPPAHLPAPPPGWQPWPPPRPPANGTAIASMILGIVAVVLEWLGLLTLTAAVLAVVLGSVGYRASLHRGTGRGQALAGIILGSVGLVAYLFWGVISAGVLLII
jgi:hypothetical protein